VKITRVPAAEAKKAAGASEETHLIPKPLQRVPECYIGWSHYRSVKHTLQILRKADLKIVSTVIKSS
jgi:hypothetical protein